MTCTSLFCSAIGSCVASVITRMISVSSFGFVAPYHFGFGVSVSATLSFQSDTWYGPAAVGRHGGAEPVEGGRDARRGVLRSPCWAAMCAG